MFNYKNMQNNKTKYINHTLNNSPSKTAYSFGQSVRFPTYTPYQGQDQQFMGHRRQLSPKRQSSSKQKQRVLRKSKSIEKRDKKQARSRSRGSRSKQKNSSKRKQAYSPKSPNQKNNKRKSRQNSPKSPQRKTSPNKGEIIKSYRNGYYPFGIEINKDGRYYVSNYESVQSHSFGKTSNRDFSYLKNQILGPGLYDIAPKSPGKYYTSDNKNINAHKFSKSPRKLTPQKPVDISPGMYNHFSQFGPVR